MTEPRSRGAGLAAYVLTLDEETHIACAVESLRQVTDRVLVLDSGSTDMTEQKAIAAGAAVEFRSFDSFEAQRNHALEVVVQRFDPEWVLTIDADERVSRRLASEIRGTVLDNSADEVDAYLIRRAVKFEGKVLRFGGVSRTRLVRLFRPSAGRYESRSVNEHFALSGDARLRYLKSAIDHEDVTSWERHVEKHNRYSTLEAEERATCLRRPGRPVTLLAAATKPYLRRRWLRERLWNHLPAKPALRFLQMYVLAGGFLDGAAGFDIAVFQAWQELCTEQKFRQIVAQETTCGNYPFTGESG